MIAPDYGSVKTYNSWPFCGNRISGASCVGALLLPPPSPAITAP